MDARRLLKRLNDVRQKTPFDVVHIVTPRSIGHKQIANDSLTAFINEERVTKNLAALHRCVTGQDFCVHVAQNHL